MTDSGAHAFDTLAVPSLDGTRITYRATRHDRGDAPTVVLANGLGGPYLAWRPLVGYLADRARFLTWDYRGLYRSGRPMPDAPTEYEIARHVDDLAAILEAERLERFAIVGWSMGVQVALEAVKRFGDRVTHLVLLNGTAGRPLDTLADLPLANRWVPRLVDAAYRVHPVVTVVVRFAARRTGFPQLLKRLSLISPSLDDAAFGEMVAAFAELDMGPFLQNLRALAQHDASEALGHVHVPTLVITGDADRFTPRGLAHQMARRIPQAELLVVRGGTHYTAVEYPDLVNLRVERFFEMTGLLDGERR